MLEKALDGEYQISENNILFLKKKIFLFLFLLMGFVFWLNFSPVYRFAIYLFVTLTFMILVNLLVKREFSKKIFIIFISIFLLFNFSKNINRLYKSDSIFLGIQKINNKYIFNESYVSKYVKIYYPDIKKNQKNGWQGRLCWDTPFICSYNKLDVEKKYGYLIINKLNN